MDAVSNRVIRDAGTPEDVWAPWLAQQCLRRVKADALCPATARLVVVAPHPDDEILSCGGLLAHRASAGWPAVIMALSDGEASHGPLAESARRSLGTRRVQESSAGLQALGSPPPPVVRFGIPDGGVSEAAEVIAAKLALRLKPSDVLLVTWRQDGHPDHEAAAHAAHSAAQAVGCRLLEAPVWMWHWAEPGDLRVPWSRMLALDLPEPARQSKLAALHCHQSQLEDRHGSQGPVLVPSIVSRAARSTEYFFELATHD